MIKGGILSVNGSIRMSQIVPNKYPSFNMSILNSELVTKFHNFYFNKNLSPNQSS